MSDPVFRPAMPGGPMPLNFMGHAGSVIYSAPDGTHTGNASAHVHATMGVFFSPTLVDDPQSVVPLGVIPEPLSMAFMGSAFVGVVAYRLHKLLRPAFFEPMSLGFSDPAVGNGRWGRVT